MVVLLSGFPGSGVGAAGLVGALALEFSDGAGMPDAACWVARSIR
jgi:hypothetical protein